MARLPKPISRHITQALGTRLRQLRGIETLAELAGRSLVSAEMISAYERGKHQPTLDKLLALQHAFQLPSLEHLLGVVESPLMPSSQLWTAAWQETEKREVI